MGASPSSAMRERYSLSIRALSWADWGGSPVLLAPRWPVKELQEKTLENGPFSGSGNKIKVIKLVRYKKRETHPHTNKTKRTNWCWSANLVYLQSEEMCPAPPHLVQRVVLVMLRGSVFCQGRRILAAIAPCMFTGLLVKRMHVASWRWPTCYHLLSEFR